MSVAPIFPQIESVNGELRVRDHEELKWTDAERAANVAPVNYAYVPGDIRRYGAVGDGSTDCQTAIDAAIDQAVESGGAEVLIPAGGTYAHSETIEWGFSNLRARATGGARLKHTGTGVANNVGDGAQAYYNITLIDLHEVGNANTTYAFDASQLGHCHFRLRGQNAVNAAFRGRFLICNRIELVHSHNETAFTTTPVNTLILDNDGTPGNFSGYNTISNLVSEGVSQYGVSFGEAVGNQILAGTSEGNAGGVSLSADAHYNAFHNFDCEQNTTDPDFSIQGHGNSFYNCNSVSSAVTDSTDVLNADATVIIGGFMRSVNLRSSATNTSIVGLRTSDNGALGIHGTGTRVQLGVIECDTSQNPSAKDPDVFGESGTFTPTVLGSATAGTTTYGTRSGSYKRLSEGILFRLRVTWTAQTGTGNLLIGGLPFTAANTDSNPVSILADALTFAGQLCAGVKPNSSQIEIFSQATGAGIASVAIDTAATVWIAGVYQI